MTRTSDEPHGVISTWLQSHLSVRVSRVPNHWPGDQYWAMDHLLLGHKDRIKNAFLFLAYHTIDPWFNSVFQPNSTWTGGGTGQLKTPKQTFCSLTCSHRSTSCPKLTFNTWHHADFWCGRSETGSGNPPGGRALSHHIALVR